MEKGATFFFLLLTASIFLFQDMGPALAGETTNISCGDYNIITRKKGDEEQLFRINNKTGETWLFKGPDIGWAKMREQG